MKTCGNCEWYGTDPFIQGRPLRVCVNRHSGKFTPGEDDSCEHWQELNTLADGDYRKILDNL